jgi:hypothetical protein
MLSDISVLSADTTMLLANSMMLTADNMVLSAHNIVSYQLITWCCLIKCYQLFFLENFTHSSAKLTSMLEKLFYFCCADFLCNFANIRII